MLRHFIAVFLTFVIFVYYLFCVTVIHAQTTPPPLPQIESVEFISKEIGPDGVNNTPAVGIYHTDLGHMINVGDTTYAFFGDSWGENAPLSSWRANLMAYGPTQNFTSGQVLNHWITNAQGEARQLFADPNPITTIPTGGTYLNQTMYLYYMHVIDWGVPGVWTCDYSSLAKSTDLGHNWLMLDPSISWLPGNFNQVAPYPIGNYLYLFGIPCGRDGNLKLMRVETSNVESKSSYEYFTGLNNLNQPEFSTIETNATTVITGPIGEMSVIWNPYLKAYLLMYLNRQDQIVLRLSHSLWGPWGEEVPVVSGIQYPCLYAPYLNEKYIQENGRIVYFRFSRLCGVTDPNSTFLMKLSFTPKLYDFDFDNDRDFLDLSALLSQFYLPNHFTLFDFTKLSSLYGQ